MATKSLGRVSIVPQGDYDENRVYKRLDLVRDNGKTYLSLKEDNNSPLLDEDAWMLITESGRFEDLTPLQLETLLQPLNDATEAANEATIAANTAAQNAVTGVSGEATEINSPEPNGFHRYIVTTPITAGSAWGIEVTQAELDDNWVFFNVRDGVITKDSKPQKEGKSAYQLAVESGFSGTESEWRDSLKGADGKGIASISKTSTTGKVDTYTITFTDASVFDFQVTNGNYSDAEIVPYPPTNLVASNITDTSFRVDWTKAIDNIGVVGYDIYINNTFHSNITDEFIVIATAIPETLYKVGIKAKDAAGNSSAVAEIEVNTIIDEGGIGKGYQYEIDDTPVPSNHYVLTKLTQEEINYGRTQSDYLVLKNNVQIQFPFSLSLPSNTTFDSREAIINCHPNLAKPDEGNILFDQVSTENTHFKCGVLIGDKFKRDFLTNPEKWNEQTYFVLFKYGAQDVSFTCRESYGWMGDTVSTNQYGIGHVVWTPEMTKSDDGYYYSAYYNLAQNKGNKIAIYGGVGYARFASIIEAKLRFKNPSGDTVTIDTEYLKHEVVPDGYTSVQLIQPVKPTDDSPVGTKRIEQIQIVQHPAGNMVIEDSYFRDHHRGSISNTMNNTVINNCLFENTPLYNTKPEFPDATKYGINPEDAVGDFLEITSCTFKNKFHTALIAANKKVILNNNKFINNSYNLVVYQSRYISFVNNYCYKGIIYVSNFTNDFDETFLEIAYNTFQGTVLKKGGNIHNNIFKNQSILGETHNDGAYDNSFINSGWNAQEGTNWHRVINNTFTNHKAYFAQVSDSLPILSNTFIDTQFDVLQNPEVVNKFIDCTFIRHKHYSNNKAHNIVYYRAAFNNSVIDDFYYGLASNNTTRHFFGGTIHLTNRSFIDTYNNSAGCNIYFYFKNVVITADQAVSFVSNVRGPSHAACIVHLIFDGCTIDPKITFPTGIITPWFNQPYCTVTYESIADIPEPIVQP